VPAHRHVLQGVALGLAPIRFGGLLRPRRRGGGGRKDGDDTGQERSPKIHVHIASVWTGVSG
jgi:hypothetical protein